MNRYKYKPLNPNDIRLVTILPGKFGDPIRIEINHATLVPPAEDEKPKRLSLKEIRKGLPKGWDAFENLEGRVVFWKDNERFSSWDHPDPSVPRADYDPEILENQDRPDYEALSYAWGPRMRRKKAIMKSTIKEQRFMVMPGNRLLHINEDLEEALRYLRYKNKGRVMWIDALCINQEDFEERNHEVKRMSLIYQFARRVVAWLGPASLNSQLALSTLDYLGRQVECTRDDWMFPAVDCEQLYWYCPEVSLPYKHEVWDAIADFPLRPWFKRLWIVQEIHLGSAKSIVQCGHDEILWSHFRRAILSINDKDEGVPHDIRINLNNAGDFYLYLGHNPFENTLYNYHMRLCSDQRDKVYGILSLAPREIRDAIEINYEKGLVEVFEHVFRAHSDKQRRLPQLQLSGLRYAESISELGKEGWPSWLPDWSRFVYRTCPSSDRYYTSGLSASCTNYTNPGRLEVIALPFASVKRVEYQFPHSPDGLVCIVEAYKRMGLSQLRDTPYPGLGGPGEPKSYLDAYLLTMTMGKVKDYYEKLQTYYSQAELLKIVDIAERSEEGIEEARSMLSDWYRGLIGAELDQKYLFSLENGHIGVIGGRPLQGDKVVVILGCETPMLLRPTPTGDYIVVGDCYVHGIMFGEALLGPFPESWKFILHREGEEDGQYRVCFVNTDTGVKRTDDPRLDEIPLPPEWEPIEWNRTTADPLHYRKFWNRETGEEINSDPRLFPEALVGRGVPLETITLV
ncbi:HET-domain-containing protein [Hypoxylon trugodes]|uniref:HET-domain-containing protein n=1 Tax=Hypoxylon trugodes TaxID=326681 RepID=UPI0021953A18|nr:HET-domain-containing protein [Hypoxylon trugodes]KAI1387256.1 HET-domain-containing protein [Hypoxylon trugodes]